MLIAVLGSSSFGGAVGVTPDRPTGLLDAGAARAGHVLLLCPWYAERTAREQAHVLIAADPRTRVCVLAQRHHVTTLSLVAATVIAQLGGPASEPGATYQLVVQSAERSRSLVWYPKPWRLREPAPTLRHRLSGLSASAGFFYEIASTSALVSAKFGTPVRAGDNVIVAGSPAELLQRQLGVPLHTAPLPGDPDAPYATKSSVELTVLVGPAHSAADGRPCRSCDATLVGGACPYCGHAEQSPLVGARAAGLAPNPSTPRRGAST